MKRVTLLFLLLLLTAILSAVEYCFGCSPVFTQGVFYIGLGVVVMATVFCIVLHNKPKDIFWCITGGIACTAAANSALSLVRIIVPHLMDDGLFLIGAVIAFCIYLAAVSFALIYIFLFYFCRFKDVLKQID